MTNSKENRKIGFTNLFKNKEALNKQKTHHSIIHSFIEAVDSDEAECERKILKNWQVKRKGTKTKNSAKYLEAQKTKAYGRKEFYVDN